MMKKLTMWKGHRCSLQYHEYKCETIYVLSGQLRIIAGSSMEKLESKYPKIQFRDMDFDISVASFIKNLPECSLFMGLPFTVYFKNGRVVKATTSIQNEKQIVDILDGVFKD